MVVFTCNACGESLKKNRVEMHVHKCRQCQCLSCMDCGKDFWGNDYQMHITCVTEEEKYSGKNFKPKANANKGEKKQEMWLSVIRNTIATAKLNPALKELLERLVAFDNIPRKQTKFENFLKQCLRIRNPKLIHDTWQIVSSALTTTSSQPSNNVPQATVDEQRPSGEVAPDGSSETAVKKSKRERKEEQRKSKPDKVLGGEHQPAVDKSSGNAEHVTDENQSKSKKSKKKRKLQSNEGSAVTNGDPEATTEIDTSETKQKRKKHHHTEVPGDRVDELPSTEEPATKKHKDDRSCEAAAPEKFHWTTVIREILETAEGKELPVKKLKKKVVAEFVSRCRINPSTREAIEAKFHKKVARNPIFKVRKDRVKLRDETNDPKI